MQRSEVSEGLGGEFHPCSLARCPPPTAHLLPPSVDQAQETLKNRDGDVRTGSGGAQIAGGEHIFFNHAPNSNSQDANAPLQWYFVREENATFLRTQLIDKVFSVISLQLLLALAATNKSQCPLVSVLCLPPQPVPTSSVPSSAQLPSAEFESQ